MCRNLSSSNWRGLGQTRRQEVPVFVFISLNHPWNIVITLDDNVKTD